MSQALPVLPQLPVLEGRRPDLRPADAGTRQSFDRLLERFTQRDVAKDTAKERTCEAPTETPKEVAESDANAERREEAPAGEAIAKADPARETAEPTDVVVAPAVVPPTPVVPAIVAVGVEPVPAAVPVIQATEAPGAAAASAISGVVPAPVQQPAAAVEAAAIAGGNAAPTTTAGVGAIAMATAPMETAARAFAMDGSAVPVAQPQVMRLAASVANTNTKPTATNGQPAAVAAPTDAALARTSLAKAAPVPEAEPADLDRQIRLDGKPPVAPSAVATDLAAAAVRDEHGTAAKTPEQPFGALFAVDTPRSAAAQYHKVAETVRTAAAADTPSPADQVSIRLLHAVAEGKRTIQMHLHPAELGTIDVKMQWQGDRLTAQFQVDRPETLVLLQRDVPALERTLNQAGVNVDSGSLSFSLRQQTGNGQNNGSGQPFDPAAAGAAFGEAADLPLGDEPLGQVIRDGILSIRV